MSHSISFIVPSYNAGQYLTECLDSILSIGGSSLQREVIVVNDGSTDDTAHILEGYQKDQVRVITQENRGLSAARNAGMTMAAGDYICFVDADDRLINADLTDMVRQMEKGVDIIGFNIIGVSPSGRKSPYRRYVPEYNKVYSPAREFMRERNLMPCAWANLYRRGFLASSGILFYEGIYHEDEEFTPRAFAEARSFVAVNINLYEYVAREDSITTTSDKAQQETKLRDMVFVLKRLTEYAGKDCDLQSCMQCKLDYLVVDILTLLHREHHTKAFRQEIISALRSIHYFPLHWRWRLKYIAFNILTRIIH